MRMAELSEASGVPIATIKYYLREGLLPPGERTSPNQARYDDAHLRRLKLVRALLEVGKLSISQVSAVLAAMDADGDGAHKVFGVAQATVTEPGLADDDDTEVARRARQRVADLVAHLRWQLSPDSVSASALARVIATIIELGDESVIGQLEERAKAMERLAELDLDLVDIQPDLESRVQMVVIGTVIGDWAMAALRRMAQEDASARRYGSRR